MSDFLFSRTDPVQGSVIDVLQVGSYDSTRYGKFEITRGDFDDYIREFQQSGAAGRRQIDFDHKGSQGDTRAAGWIQNLHVEGDKLKATVEWTPAGRAAVEGKEYRFTSAEYQTKVRDKNTGEEKEVKRLKAVTLTNRPFIDTMDPVTLSDDPNVRIYLATDPDAKSDAGTDKPASAGGPPEADVCTPQQAQQIGDQLGVQWANVQFTSQDLCAGINEELEEHGPTGPAGKKLNVIGTDPVKAAKIALAHLLVNPQAYATDPDDPGGGGGAAAKPAPRKPAASKPQPAPASHATQRGGMYDEIDRIVLSTGTIGGTKIAKLPKSSYAWVDSTGTGHLPYKDSSGKTDPSHTRNALARLNQVQGMSDAERSAAKGKLEAALRSVGGSPSGNNNTKRKQMSEIHTLLGLSDDADDAALLSAVTTLVEKSKEPPEGTVSLAEFTILAEKVVNTQKAHEELLRDTYLSEQVRSGRITPAEMEEGSIVVLYDASPDAARKMIEARRPSLMLRELGESEEAGQNGGGAVTADDIWTKDHKEGARGKLDARAKQLMADNVTSDYGEALVLAEKEAIG